MFIQKCLASCHIVWYFYMVVVVRHGLYCHVKLYWFLCILGRWSYVTKQIEFN